MMHADFQHFQRSFGHHLRDPHHAPRPAGVSSRGCAVYQELVFNNLCGFLDACFPVSRQLLGEVRWRRLNRTFLRDWPQHSPWFRDIPQAFTRYLAEGTIAQPLPRWLADLAHYEWTELVVDTLDCTAPPAASEGDLMQRPVRVNPAMRLVRYDWPVHLIGEDYRPRRPQPTTLAVYRGRDLTIRFTELNPLTLRLLTCLRQPGMTGQRAVEQVAAESDYPAAQLLAHAPPLLDALRDQEILLGIQP